MSAPAGDDLPIDPDAPPGLLPAIAVGGALGSLARWGLATAIGHSPGGFAWSTLITNLSGAFCLAVLMVLISELWPTQRLVRPFFGVGVLGGFTTFSTWMLDTRASWVTHPLTAISYVGLTLIGGLLATLAGLLLTPRLLGRIRDSA